MTNIDNALSLVPQIIAEYDAVTSVVDDAYLTALQHAIKCGEFLTLAKETVTKAAVAWQTWRAENLRDIPQTTASLYMRLYENRDFLAEVSNNALLGTTCGTVPDGSVVLTIRRANEIIKHNEAAKRTPEQQAAIDARVNKTKATRAANKAAVAKPGSSGGSPSIQELLPDIAPDELLVAIETTWKLEQIAELATLLARRLNAIQQQQAA